MTLTTNTTAEAPAYTVPGMSTDDARTVIEGLQDRLAASIDLQLTLKHVHWNVVGPNFIGVHEMLDPMVDSVREMSDELAERIATLGGSPVGTPGKLTDIRRWSDYSLMRDTTLRHLAALDSVFEGVISDHRTLAHQIEETDPVTEDLLVDHLGKLEQYHWFVRAHLENPSGSVTEPGRAS